MRWPVIFALCAGSALAQGETAGEFDYYVLSLSWSPNWCALEGSARGSPQCGEDARFGWILHGLWPQYETGWPSYCPTLTRDPSRSQTEAMADIMGTSGLAWHQWKKHGRCSGLEAMDYFITSRRAFDGIAIPEVFQKLDRPVTLPATVVEAAFLSENPHLEPDMITVTCNAGGIQEARICLSRELLPRRCGQDVIRDCSLADALLRPIR